MTANETPDTITVELPIEASGDDYVGVEHAALATRERWREIAADPVGADTSALTARVAPAVVAWIERDEADPIKIPADGSKIRATLGDGSVHVIAVKGASRVGKLAGVIQSSITQYRVGEWTDGHEDPQRDIIAWEYVDEPVEVTLSPAVAKSIADQLQASVDTLKATVDAIRVGIK